MKKKKNFKSILLSIVLTLLAIFLVLEIVSFNSITTSENDGLMYSQDQVDEMVTEAKEEGRKDILTQLREALESGRSVINVLKSFYPDQLVVASSGAYHWVDINEDLKMNDYDIDNLVVDDDGVYSYVVDGVTKSKKGIDVSSHQGDIDWDAVAADGVEFVFVRALYRGYGSGEIVYDDNCIKNINGARAAGIPAGVYVFSQAISEDEAIEEADAIIEMLEGTTIDLPIVFDVEKLTNNEARMNALTVEERTKVAIAFLEHVKEAGFDVMIYHNTEMGAMLIDMTQLEDYDKWFAGYNKEFYWPYAYKYWQYSESGQVDGIDSDVDMDLMFIE